MNQGEEKPTQTGLFEELLLETNRLVDTDSWSPPPLRNIS